MAADPAATEPAKKFVCGVATGAELGYPDDAYNLVQRRIRDCVDAPGLEVRGFNRGTLEVYADSTITETQQRLVEAVVWGFSLGFRTAARKRVTITIRRQHDDWYAFVEGRPEVWAANKTSSITAVGDLVSSHPELLDTVIRVDETDEQTKRYIAVDPITQ